MTRRRPATRRPPALLVALLLGGLLFAAVAAPTVGIPFAIVTICVSIAVLLDRQLQRALNPHTQHPGKPGRTSADLRMVRIGDGYWVISAEHGIITDCAVRSLHDDGGTVDISIRLDTPSIRGFDQTGAYHLQSAGLEIVCTVVTDDPERTRDTYLHHHGRVRIETTGTVLHDGTRLLGGPVGGELLDVRLDDR